MASSTTPESRCDSALVWCLTRMLKGLKRLLFIHDHDPLAGSEESLAFRPRVKRGETKFVARSDV